MQDLSQAFVEAFRLLASFDPQLVEIMLLTFEVSLSALAIATVLGLPFGALLALVRFPGRGLATIVLNASMGLPPVVVGLLVYLLLSRSGPLAGLGWLFTPKAMIVAQVALITPIVAALSRQVVADLWEEYGELLSSLGASRVRAVPTLLWDGRFTLITTVLAGFGRAIGEVGAVIIVGGNIAHVTRVMTTAITLETSKGDLPLALGLGFVLLLASIALNAAVVIVQNAARGAEAA